jgi:DNA adenine methylase
MAVKTPIRWFGGKGNMLAKLRPYIPPHRTYVEPYGGAAALLFDKEPAPVEVYNDLNDDLVNLYRVLRDPEQFAAFQRLATLTLYSRTECLEAQRRVKEEEGEGVERAWTFWVACRMGFSGCGDDQAGWSYARTASRRGMAGTCSRFLSCIDALPRFHERLSRVQIESDDALAVMDRYDTPETFFYLDPPYVLSTRKEGGYKHEMTEEQHETLVAHIQTLEGMVLLSGYAQPIYDALPWETINFETASHAAGHTRGTGILGKGAAMKKQKRTETLWINPALRKALSGEDAQGLFEYEREA